MASVQVMPRRTTRSPEGQLFGDALRVMRKERGLSQEALAERADMAADYLGFIERGENVPTLTIILKLAIALDCTPAELLADFSPAALRRLKLI